MVSGSKNTITMTLEKETKGAVRYQQVDASGTPIKGDDNGALAETIYFRKKALGDAPQRIKVTVEAL